jgi:hypothetical protein
VAAQLAFCVLLALVFGIKLGTIVGMEYRQALMKTSQWFRSSHPFRGQAAAEVHKHKVALERERGRNRQLARWIHRLRREVHGLKRKPKIKERGLVWSGIALSAFMLATGFCLRAGIESFSRTAGMERDAAVPVDRDSRNASRDPGSLPGSSVVPRASRSHSSPRRMNLAFVQQGLTMTPDPERGLRIPLGRRWPEEELSTWPSVSYDILFYWPIESDLPRPKVGPTDAALEHAWISLY